MSDNTSLIDRTWNNGNREADGGPLDAVIKANLKRLEFEAVRHEQYR